MPMAEAGGGGDRERLEAAEQGGGERRDDEQRRRGRVEPGDRLDEDDRDPGEHRGDSAQLTAPSRSGEMPTSSAPFSLPAAARVGQAEAGEAEHDAEHDGDHHDEGGEEQAVLGDGGAEDRAPGRRAGPGGDVTTAAPATGNRRRTISWR